MVSFFIIYVKSTAHITGPITRGRFPQILDLYRGGGGKLDIPGAVYGKPLY